LIRFYKPKIKKIEPNSNRKKTWKKPRQTGKKPSQNEKIKSNRFEAVFVLKNRTELKAVCLNRFQFQFFCLKKDFWFGYFFYKNRIEPKMITPKYL